MTAGEASDVPSRTSYNYIDSLSVLSANWQIFTMARRYVTLRGVTSGSLLEPSRQGAACAEVGHASGGRGGHVVEQQVDVIELLDRSATENRLHTPGRDRYMK